MSTYETLLADAAKLSVADRIRLIDAIEETLPDGSLPPLSDEWLAEIRKRSAELEAGAVETIPWEQVRAAARLRWNGAVPVPFPDDGLLELADEQFQSLDPEESGG